MSKTNIVKCGGCDLEISVTDERFFFWIGGDENPCCGHEPCAIKTGHREADSVEIRTALHLALIKGRHETPATDWVFDAIEDVHDYDAMNKRAGDYLHETAGEGLEFGMLLDVYLYVTGLSSALVATLKAWEEYDMRYFGHQLTLMHYDRDTDSYKAQPWWDGFKWGE